MTIDNQWSDIQEWMGKSRQFLIKKLSRNDCGWADGSENGHQNGVYIPRAIRESDFFPQLKNVNQDKPHIFESQFKTLWPATGEVKTSNLKHYSNKGPEMHFTGVPKGEFAGLTPASLMIGGLLREPDDEIQHWFMIVDSASEEVELLEAMFDLGAEFHYGLFDPADALKIRKDETEQLVDELSLALKNGALSSAAIDDMSNQGIHLVVPESLKKSKETCYNGKLNVITFREFFDEEISAKRPSYRRI